MKSYSVSMRRTVKLAFFTAVAVTAAVAAWCFKAGFMWSGIFLVVVAAPFAGLYWYMLSVNPARTEIQILDDGMRVKAPPFVDEAVLWDDVQQVFESDLSDAALAFKGHSRAMRFGGYRTGVFELKAGGEVVVVANGRKVVCVRTQDRLYVLGPDQVGELAAELAVRAG
ncbi:MAG: PH domain-containing protein [Desulfovibrionaceae bacterium]